MEENSYCQILSKVLKFYHELLFLLTFIFPKWGDKQQYRQLEMKQSFRSNSSRTRKAWLVL